MMNESDIQTVLYDEFSRRGHLYITPNVYMGLVGEMDLMSVTKAGYLNEFEIKISRGDFKADFKKRKHFYMENKLHLTKLPNYFWFVMPMGLVYDHYIPDYAGHIEVALDHDSVLIMTVVKKPKLIHNNKITDFHLKKILMNLGYKFWRLRGQR